MQVAKPQVVCYLCENMATHTVYFVHVCTQLCLTLCNLMDCSLTASSAHEILQARILEQVASGYLHDPNLGLLCPALRQILYHCQFSHSVVSNSL